MNDTTLVYTPRFLLTGYAGLIWCSAAVATFLIPLRVLWGYYEGTLTLLFTVTGAWGYPNYFFDGVSTAQGPKPLHMSKDFSHSKNSWLDSFLKFLQIETHFYRFFLPLKFVKWDPPVWIFWSKWDSCLRIFGEKVTHLGGTSPYALTCEYPFPTPGDKSYCTCSYSVAAEYPHSNLKGTLTYISHSRLCYMRPTLSVMRNLGVYNAVCNLNILQ